MKLKIVILVTATFLPTAYCHAQFLDMIRVESDSPPKVACIDRTGDGVVGSECNTDIGGMFDEFSWQNALTGNEFSGFIYTIAMIRDAIAGDFTRPCISAETESQLGLAVAQGGGGLAAKSNSGATAHAQMYGFVPSGMQVGFDYFLDVTVKITAHNNSSPALGGHSSVDGAMSCSYANTNSITLVVFSDEDAITVFGNNGETPIWDHLTPGQTKVYRHREKLEPYSFFDPHRAAGRLINVYTTTKVLTSHYATASHNTDSEIEIEVCPRIQQVRKGPPKNTGPIGDPINP